MSKWSWIAFAIASGCVGASNGLFAKLTTDNATAASVAERLGEIASLIVRGLFFLVNAAGNGIMWTLFTIALTRADSATKVTVVNTSANFITTALLGSVVFGEEQTGQWWLGAALMIAGNFIVSLRKESLHEAIDTELILQEDVSDVPEGERPLSSGSSFEETSVGRRARAASVPEPRANPLNAPP